MIIRHFALAVALIPSAAAGAESAPRPEPKTIELAPGALFPPAFRPVWPRPCGAPSMIPLAATAVQPVTAPPAPPHCWTIRQPAVVIADSDPSMSPIRSWCGWRCGQAYPPALQQ